VKQEDPWLLENCGVVILARSYILLGDEDSMYRK
jgi:hypothetical protein